MDLRGFYQKVRQVEKGIKEAHVVIVSLDTPDGGRAGVMTETSRALAARLTVEGKARLATEDETASYRANVAEAKRAVEQLAAANRMQLTVVSESDLKALKTGLKGTRA